MSESSSNSVQNALGIPFMMPATVPSALQSIIQPIYTIFQNIMWALVNFCGIAPLTPAAQLQRVADPTTALINNMGRFYATNLDTVAMESGDLVQVVASAGTLGFKLAIANTSGSKPACAFVSSPGGIPVSGIGEFVIFPGIATLAPDHPALPLIPGAVYYLSTTVAGKIQITRPTVGAEVVIVGYAASTTQLVFLYPQLTQ
jgi:hypothetical protein